MRLAIVGSMSIGIAALESIAAPPVDVVFVAAPAEMTRPKPLPTAARFVPFKPAFADPTADRSAAFVTAAAPPLRTTPAPFAATNIPDPDEAREQIKLTTPLPEEALPKK